MRHPARLAKDLQAAGGQCSQPFRQCALVVQLDRTPDYESGSRGFDSLRARDLRPPATGTSIFIIEALFLIAIALIPFVFWTATRWSMAVTLTLVENLTVLGSFARSWRLTHDRFWVCAGFNVAVTLAVFVISLAPITVVFAAFHTFRPSASLDITNGFLNAVLSPVLIYAQIARWAAYVKWLAWLKSSEKLEAASA
jgi:hypothetical protein